MSSFFPISPCCLTSSDLPGDPRGVMQPKDAEAGRGVARYYSIPADGVKHPKVALVLFTDFFGFNIPNGKILADLYADKLGVAVYVPDYLPGWAAPPEPGLLDALTPAYPGANDSKSWWWTISSWLNVLPRVVPLMWSNRAALLIPSCRAALDDLKAEEYETIGAIGFCRGGGMIINLLGTGAPIDCGVICHPSPESVSLAKGITKPTQWHAAGEDTFFTPRLAEDFCDVIKSSGTVAELTVWPNTSHGYAFRPVMSHEPTKEAFDGTHEKAVEFLKKYLFP